MLTYFAHMKYNMQQGKTRNTGTFVGFELRTERRMLKLRLILTEY